MLRYVPKGLNFDHVVLLPCVTVFAEGLPGGLGEGRVGRTEDLGLCCTVTLRVLGRLNVVSTLLLQVLLFQMPSIRCTVFIETGHIKYVALNVLGCVLY